MALPRCRLGHTGGVVLVILVLMAAVAGRAQDTGQTSQDAGAKTKAPTYMEAYTGADAEKIGSTTCLMCHPDRKPESRFAHVALLDLDTTNPNYGFGCEACHGPGGNHNGNPNGIISPKKLDTDQVIDLCTKCHMDLRTFDAANYRLSKHYYSGKSCLACHSGHTDNPKFLVKSDVLELCYSCHAEKRAEFKMRSHHPVPEGQLSCDNCHNPMSGEFPGQLRAEGDELCFQCHSDKQGPFTYDHDMSSAVGGSGCLTCHFIHGSNSDHLLKFPHWLCIQCHTDRTAATHYAGNCWSTGCHVNIHGSYSSPLFFE